MIDVSYHIMLYGENLSAASLVPEEISEKIGQMIKVKLSKHNSNVVLFYSLSNHELEDEFLGKALKSIKLIWQTQAKKHLIGYIRSNDKDMPDIAKIIPGKNIPSEARILDRALQSLLEIDGLPKLKTALTLFDWDELNEQAKGKKKPENKKGGLWSSHTHSSRKGRFYLLRFGIEHRDFHMDIGHDDQCNYETGEETIRLMQNIGLSLSFTCYESDITDE